MIKRAAPGVPGPGLTRVRRGLGVLLLATAVAGPAAAEDVTLNPRVAQIVVGIPGGTSLLGALGAETPTGSGYYRIVYPPMPATSSSSACESLALDPVTGKLRSLIAPTGQAPPASAAESEQKKKDDYAKKSMEASQCLLKAISQDYAPPALTAAATAGLARFVVTAGQNGSNGGTATETGAARELQGEHIVGYDQASGYDIVYLRPAPPILQPGSDGVGAAAGSHAVLVASGTGLTVMTLTVGVGLTLAATVVLSSNSSKAPTSTHR